MMERIASALTLQHRVPEYQRRAGLLRRQAIMASITEGVLIDESKGVVLIEHSQTSIVPVGNRELEFAIGNDGICFARIKEGKYYKLDTSLSEDLLKESREYDRLSKNTLRRIVNEPLERIFGRRLFTIQEGLGGLSAVFTALAIRLEQMTDKVSKLPEVGS
ncbi:MAG: hypothetical protein UX80_C0015G0021 [Candidatus Amesbacteria bacterium GW2011_GWA2_47_11b]|uniref:Uncharacterized protein n=1 Tax=Candidatus Amesbacteria bacterium GW2011_GWA2_47_11b TaxID=1618358 RepID=A0A0G1RK75_9BACT|nr:MAG: hypothetical protein UX80_C0015G0021 [Candidatus Amesbacteria bacterium GW2011_GWA2_47_11b]